jgi:hypothetical protein
MNFRNIPSGFLKTSFDFFVPVITHLYESSFIQNPPTNEKSILIDIQPTTERMVPFGLLLLLQRL